MVSRLSVHRSIVRILSGVAFAALLCVVSVGASLAQEMGPLNKYLEVGEFAPWTAKAEGPSYVLSNPTDPTAIHYVLADYTSAEAGRRTIAVDVEIREGTEQSGAGLLYGYQQEPRSYFLLVLRPSGQVTLTHRHPGGFDQMMSIGGDQVRPGVNRLEIHEKGNLIDILLNGQSIGSLGNDLMGRGAAGIVALGTGTFAFANYAQAVQ